MESEVPTVDMSNRTEEAEAEPVTDEPNRARSNASRAPSEHSMVSCKHSPKNTPQWVVESMQSKRASLLRCLELEREIMCLKEAEDLARRGSEQKDEPEYSAIARPLDPQTGSSQHEDYLSESTVRFGRHQPETESLQPHPVSPFPAASTSVALDLPKFELESFDGTPQRYWTFIRQFENFIEPRLTNLGQRLLYLRHYCRGSARDAIEGCLMLPPEQGYYRARQILSHMFGQPHAVARSLIDGLIPHSRSIPNNAESMNQLAIRMTNCELTLSQMKLTSDLNSSITLESIVRALPNQLQFSWARKADDIMSKGMEPKFADLNVLINDHARMLSNRYGQIAVSSELKRQVGQRTLPDRAETNRVSRPGALLSTSGNVSCEYCNDTHEISTCSKFSSLSVEQRWQFVKSKRLCFSCLKGLHVVSRCMSNSRCQVEGCHRKHHTLLHRTEDEHQSVVCAATSNSKAPRLGVIPVNVLSPEGVFPTYAFLDNGSDTTLMRRSLLDRTGIKGNSATITVATMNGEKVVESVRSSLVLFSLDGSAKIEIDNVYAVPDIPIKAADICNEASRWDHLQGVKFDELVDKEVELLIGCDASEVHSVLGQRFGRRNEPFAVQGPLGWVLHGAVPRNGDKVISNYVSGIMDPIVKQLRYMYEKEFEDIPSSNKALSIENLQSIDDQPEDATPVRYEDANYPVSEVESGELIRCTTQDPDTMYELKKDTSVGKVTSNVLSGQHPDYTGSMNGDYSKVDTTETVSQGNFVASDELNVQRDRLFRINTSVLTSKASNTSSERGCTTMVRSQRQGSQPNHLAGAKNEYIGRSEMTRTVANRRWYLYPYRRLHQKNRAKVRVALNVKNQFNCHFRKVLMYTSSCTSSKVKEANSPLDALKSVAILRGIRFVIYIKPSDVVYKWFLQEGCKGQYLYSEWLGRGRHLSYDGQTVRHKWRERTIVYNLRRKG